MGDYDRGLSRGILGGETMATMAHMMLRPCKFHGFGSFVVLLFRGTS